MLSIDLAPLSTGVHQLELEPEAGALDLDPEKFKEIEVGVVLDYEEERVLVTMRARALVQLECDRTLALFDQPVEGGYSVLFASPRYAQPRFEDKDSDEPYEEVRELPSDHSIDLTDMVRDTLVLAIPIRKVAPGAEDMEIETEFGAPADDGEESIDPRWEALRALKSGNGEG